MSRQASPWGAKLNPAEFLSSNGTLNIGPDGTKSLFETPLVGPSPEALNLIR